MANVFEKGPFRYQADFPPVGKDRNILNELQVRFRIKDIGEISELDGIVS